MASAIDQLLRALEGREQQLGADHPDTLNAVDELAQLLHDQGKLADAQPLYRRALDGREQQLGAQHADTLISVHNLALLLQAQGKPAEAEPLMRRYAGSREMAAARCLGCFTQHKLKTCVKCHVARFCSNECIARAWPLHKPNCKLWRAEQQS